MLGSVLAGLTSMRTSMSAMLPVTVAASIAAQANKRLLKPAFEFLEQKPL